jgi:peptidoglycan/xylan/chitin deacetylase (PgdA/CDA1 family)
MTAFVVGGAALVLLGGSAYIVPPMLLRAVQAKRLAQWCAEHRTLVLSYDDGPGPVTPRLLDLFAERGVHATFFVLGRRAERDPAIVDRASAEGHEIATHSHDHLHAWKSPPTSWTRDFVRGIETTSRWNPRPIFRPPYGKLTLPGLLAARAWAAGIGWWTIDSHDTWDAPQSDDALAQAAYDGGVVLMHDHHPNERADLVLGYTRRLLDLADEKGLSVRRLGDVLGEMDHG